MRDMNSDRKRQVIHQMVGINKLCSHANVPNNEMRLQKNIRTVTPFSMIAYP